MKEDFEKQFENMKNQNKKTLTEEINKLEEKISLSSNIESIKTENSMVLSN